MARRNKLVIAVPAILAILVGVALTLSLPIFNLGPERFSIYTTDYVESDFSIDDLTVTYYDADELTVQFYISGGDGAKDLIFKFICRDSDDELIYSTSTGTMTLEAVGSVITNSTSLDSGDLVIGELHWSDVPVGDQRIKAKITLDNIVLDTESFHIELHQ